MAHAKESEAAPTRLRALEEQINIEKEMAKLVAAHEAKMEELREREKHVGN